jgi:CheY-like chemotaxis protein
MPANKKRKNILLVDDSVDILRAMGFLLETNGFEIACAENGREALELLRSGAPLPDLIVLDMMMPVMDGVAFRKEQISEGALAGIPTILATALSRAAIKEIKDVTFDRILCKPISIDELLKNIQELT